MRERPSVREIECFVAVAEELHFSRAAKRLHLSQPPLTRHIQQLESKLAVTLLIRDRRAVSLTPAGELFLTDARALLNSLDQAADSAQRAQQGEPVRLALGFIGALLSPDLISILRSYRKAFPSTQIQLFDLPPAEQLTRLAAGELDGGFIGALPAKLPRALAGMVWKREPLLIGLPEDHPLASRKAIRLSDLQNESWVMVSRSAGPAFRKQFDELCAKAKFRPRIAHETERVQAVLTMVAAGSGMTLVPETVTDLVKGGVEFRPILGKTPVLEHAFVHPKKTNSEALQAFLKLVRNAA
jgi:DNA-binding transcriptional LysR family regulator